MILHINVCVSHMFHLNMFTPTEVSQYNKTKPKITLSTTSCNQLLKKDLPESPGISRPPAHAAILPSSLPPPGGLEHECCNLKPWYAMICHDMPWCGMMWHDTIWYQQLKSVMSVMCFVGSTCQQVKGLGGSLGSVGNLSQIKIVKVNNHLAM